MPHSLYFFEAVLPLLLVEKQFKSFLSTVFIDCLVLFGIGIVKEKVVPHAGLRAKNMRNLNDVMLSGNVVRDPSTRTVDETTYVDFTIASNRTPRKVGDDWKTRADFIPMTASGKIAEKLANLKKGDFLTARGSVESYNYEKNDATVYGIRIRVAEIIDVQKKASEPAMPEPENPFGNL